MDSKLLMNAICNRVNRVIDRKRLVVQTGLAGLLGLALLSVDVHAQTTTAELQLLRQELLRLRVDLAQQHQEVTDRLTRLEQAIAPSYEVRVVGDEPLAAPESAPKPVVRPVVTKPRWQHKEAWDSIEPGMNRAEVEAILGKPSYESRSIIDYVTLHYANSRGTGANRQRLTGSITLTDNDRVEFRGINSPKW